MPVRIAVFAEADADRRLVCGLIDRKIWEHRPDWWGENSTEELNAARVWSGAEPETLFTRWSDLRHLLSSHDALRGARVLGFRTNLGAARFDGAAAWKALVYCVLKMTPRPDAAVLIRDMDQQPDERRASIEAAAEHFADAHALAILLALPAAKRESWVLNGFEPRNPAEDAALAEARNDLGFDPCSRAEQLSASTHGAQRDAKRVLRLLIEQGDDDRESSCWEETPWAVLRSRGDATGLKAFLSAVKEKLIPLARLPLLSV